MYEVFGYFIEKCFVDDDVFICCQGGFLIIFLQMGGVEVEVYVEEINDELNEFFLGEDWLEKLCFEVEVWWVLIDEFLSIVVCIQVEDSVEMCQVCFELEQIKEVAEEVVAGWEKKIEIMDGFKGFKGGCWEKIMYVKV